MMALPQRAQRSAADVSCRAGRYRWCDPLISQSPSAAARLLVVSAVIVMDIDHFKRVNDDHGHQVGDRVLYAVGAAIAATLRTSDFAGRYGGEECVFLLPDTALTAR